MMIRDSGILFWPPCMLCPKSPLFWNRPNSVNVVKNGPYRERGAGTNLKVGAHWKMFCHAPPLLALQVQLVVFVSAFVIVSRVWSVSCLLFFYSRCPPCPAICKSGGTCVPGALWSRRHCTEDI